MKVKILDTYTGQTIERTEFDSCWWAEGNGSCDCNRGLFMGVGSLEAGYCSGHERFLIIETDDGRPAAEYNRGYPKEMLTTAGIL